MKTKIYYEVSFYSPGSFFAESSSVNFDELDYKKFVQEAKKIKERYGASPFGFQWSKLEVPMSPPEVEGFQVKVEPNCLGRSGMVYLTGKLVFAKDISDDALQIMKTNLENNSGGIGIENNNSWKYNGFFNEKDEIVDWDGNIIRRGNDEDLMEIRRENDKA